MIKRQAVLFTTMLLVGCQAGNGANRPPEQVQGGAAASAAASFHPWAVSPRGAGDARIGMTLAELQPLLNDGENTRSIGDACEYVEIRDAPPQLGFMVEGGRLVRIDVRESGVPTIDDLEVGDGEADVLARHPAARRLPHKYVPGHQYLIALPEAPADTVHRYVFETDGTVITRLRAGVYPQVEYVEGCG